MMFYVPPPPASDGSNDSNYRFRAFHKTGFQCPPTSIAFPPNDSNIAPQEKDHRFVRRFHGPGVERQFKPRQFAYGSEASYKDQSQDGGGRQQMGFENKTSAELIKLRRQQQEAEMDIKAHHGEKSKRHLERATEKRKDLEMLQSYRPWGKPAPGAPRQSPSGSVDTRRQKLDAEQAGNADSGGRSDAPSYDPFGRPGAGAPLRSTSGKLVASLKVDPDTWFQRQLRREVEGPLRYKDGSGQGEQGWGVGKPGVQRTDSEKARQMEKREKQLVYARKLEQQRIEVLERRANEKAAKKATEPLYYPWGQDQPTRDESGKVEGRKRAVARDNLELNPKFAGLAFQMGRQGGGGAPLRDSDGKIRTKRSTSDGTTGQVEESFDPWGKPGAGAPLRNTKGQTVTTVYGKCYREQQGTSQSTSDVTTKRLDIRRRGGGAHLPDPSKDYYTDLQHQAEERHRQKRSQREGERRPEQQLADRGTWMWGGEQGSSEDESQRQQEYCQELRKMIDEREEERKGVRQQRILKEREHIKAFSHQWGKPGAGAPRVNRSGQIETTAKNFGSMLETQVYTGKHYRRA